MLVPEHTVFDSVIFGVDALFLQSDNFHTVHASYPTNNSWGEIVLSGASVTLILFVGHVFETGLVVMSLLQIEKDSTEQYFRTQQQYFLFIVLQVFFFMLIKCMDLEANLARSGTNVSFF